MERAHMAEASHSLREKAKTIAGVRSRSISSRTTFSSSGEDREPSRAAAALESGPESEEIAASKLASRKRPCT